MDKISKQLMPQNVGRRKIQYKNEALYIELEK